MLTPSLGVRKQGGTVYYLHSGMPIFSHGENEPNTFRYITSNLILQGLCKNCDISRVFHVSADSVRRYKKILDTEGEGAFFREELRHGKSHKLLPDVLQRIQGKLDKGQSAYSIAKGEGISEGSIRYAIKQGRLKKKPGHNGSCQKPE